LSDAKESSSRRDFLKIAGSFAAGAVVAGAAVAATQPVVGPAVTQTVTETLTQTVPPSVGDIGAFRSALERDGFVVGQGASALFPVIEAYEAGLIKQCWGNDPTKPYLVCLVPPAPGEQVPSYKFKIGEFLGLKGVTILFRMRPDEALVFVGRTPPECKYYSYCGYLMEKFYGNESRVLFADLTDSLNQLTINTEGTPNGSEGNSFDKNTVIVSTADRGIDKRVRAAAISAGYSPAIMNTYVIPSPILNMGLEDDSDTFNFFIRPSYFKDQQAGDAYIKNPPAAILRLTPKERVNVDPYSVPELRVRGIGKTEHSLMPVLSELRNAILARYGELEATDLEVCEWIPEGYDAIQRGINVSGPTRDALYLWTGGQLQFYPPVPSLMTGQAERAPKSFTLADDPNEFVVVYGVNHEAYGKAALSLFVVYGADIWNGVGGVGSHQYSGTAEEYLPGNPDAKYLYAYKIGRRCDGKNCFKVPGPGLKAHGIELDQPTAIAFRVYLEKATKVGPAKSEILWDRAIKFSPRK
jgi:hypothetical protein